MTVRGLCGGANRVPTSRLSVLVVLATLLSVTSAAADDVLILKNGKQRTGRITACSEDSCRLGSDRIPLSEIVWIGLEPKSATPPSLAPANASVVVLRAGGEKRGKFVGLSLGGVTLEEADIDREDVAWIRLADLTAASPHAPTENGGPSIDAVALRDGSVKIGDLVACAGATCYLEGVGSLRRSDIAAIAFGGGSADKGGQTPAGGADTQDRLVLVSGGTRDGAVYGVSPEDVVATTGTYQRNAVSAILFAEESRDTPDAYGAPQDAPPPPTQPPSQPPPGPQPTPPPTQPPTPPGPPPPSRPPVVPTEGTRGRLWTGTIDGHISVGATDLVTEWTIHLDAKLREYTFPMLIPGRNDLRSMGTISRFASEGSVLRNSVRCRSQYLTCSGEGTATITNDVTPSEMFRKTTADPMMPGYGFEVPQGEALYFVGVGAENSQTFEITTRTQLETSVATSQFIGLIGGRSPLLPPFGYSDLEYRYLVGGAMIGSFSRTLDDGDSQVSVSWAICPEGIACPQAPPLPEGGTDPDPCARAGTQAAFRDTCESQLDAKLESLGPALAEYNDHMKQAEENREHFEEAQRYCQYYDKAKEVLEAILTGGAGSAAQAARSLMYLRDVIERVQSGDIASMFYPDQVKEYLGYLNKAKAIWFEMTADELAKMTQSHNGCSGKVPIDHYMGAKKFLEHLGAAKRVWDSGVAPGMNDLRTLGLECAYLDHAAWRECFRDAECRGVPPDCGPEPSLEGAYDDR